MKKKKFNISQEIIDSASECKKDFSCLSNARVMCKVKKHEEKRVMYVRNCGHKNCPFGIPIQKDCLCTCPVRVEIYGKYKV